jgi:hypothetical protein
MMGYLCGIGEFVRRRRIQARFGELSRAPLQLLRLPNTLLAITLASNFGTFMLYMLSCVICIVAYQGHPNRSALKHFLILVFGLLANVACMVFYIVGPFMGYGTRTEPLLALGVAAVWAIYGAIYFTRSSRVAGRSTLVMSRP